MHQCSTRLPIIEAYWAGDHQTVYAIAEQAPKDDPMQLHYQALHAGLSALLVVRGHLPEAYKAMHKALAKPPSNAELFAILLRVAVELALRSNKIAEAQQCLRLLKQIDDPALSQEMRTVLPLASESRVFYFLGDYDKAFACADTALRSGHTSGGMHWYQLKALRVMYGCLIGKVLQAQRDLDEMSHFPELAHHTANPFHYMKALVCRARGLFGEALALLDGMTQEQCARIHPNQLRLRIQILVLLGRTAEAEALLDQELRPGKRTFPLTEYENLRALAALAKADFDHARFHARKAIASTYGANLIDWHWSMDLLIEAELSARNPNVARSILRMVDQDESRSSHRMQWVRLRLLEGAPEKASTLFHKLVAEVDPEVVQEGLRFAYELKPAELAKLWLRPGSQSAQSGHHAAMVQDEELLIGSSQVVQEVKRQIGRFAAADATVLLTGETGTGKELVARLLHRQSPQAAKPFLPVNCGAISDTLIESELFGYVKGAFTGAMRDHHGLFVAAGDGMLFLDEIEATSPHMQAALLRVLEEREVRPVGSTKPQRVRARVIVASNQPLEGQGFRRDLFFRLSKLHISLPPLRERVEDIPLLIKYFLHGIYGADDVVIANDLLQAMQRHPWPGNIRELKNSVERIALLAGSDKIWHADLFALGLPPRNPVAPQPEAPPAEVRLHAMAGAGRPKSGRYACQRMDQLRSLFREHHKLTRAEIVRQIGCAVETANRDLEALERDGEIRRVFIPLTNRTSYFVSEAARLR